MLSRIFNVVQNFQDTYSMVYDSSEESFLSSLTKVEKSDIEIVLHKIRKYKRNYKIGSK